MDFLEGAVVRAIDLGYGNVKYTRQHREAFSTIECDLFPSRSPMAGDNGLAAGVMQGRNTVVIKVNGSDYEVGHDVAKAQGTFDISSVLDKDFCLSDPYLARLRGALYYMMGGDSKTGLKHFKGNHINLLVVGLPVSSFRSVDLRTKLIALLTGSHELPNDRTVVVDEVMVMPQPIGAFFEYAFDKNMLDSLRKQTNLIIDPGFFTFDWVLCEGLTPIDGRSDSVNRGMSAVIKEIADAAKKQEGWDKADSEMLTRMLDEYFREGRPFIVYGKNYDVEDYISAGKTIIQQAVSAVSRSVGDGADIQNIIVAGGGATVFLEAIKDKFSRHTIQVRKDPVFSNVRGFQLVGERQIIKNRLKARKVNSDALA